MTDRLAALKPLFVARCGEDLAGLRRAKKEGDTLEIGRLAHRLAGSAGSFGFPEISRLALIVDEGCRADAATLEHALNELIAVLDQIDFGRSSLHGSVSPN